MKTPLGVVLLITFSLLLGPLQVFSANDKFVNVARTKTGEVVKVGPEADGDVKSIPEMLKNLKKGTIVHFMPGNYDKSIEIGQDNIVIEGEPGKFCGISITITGKNCSIRNIWLSYVYAKLDLAVVDSVVNEFSIGDDAKADFYFNNSCFRKLSVHYYNKRVFIENCTISGQNDTLSLDGSQINVENSIICSKDNAIRFSNWNRVKLTISNSLVYGGGTLATGNDDKTIVTEVKELKNLCNFTKKGNIITEKPSFEVELQKPVEGRAIRGMEERVFFYCREYQNLMSYVLKAESPGKSENLGASLDDKGFPVAQPVKK